MTRTLLEKVRSYIDSPTGAHAALAGAFIFAVLVTVLFITPGAYGPIHFSDELRYWETALSLADGSFKVALYHHYPPLYPLSLLPAMLFFSPYQAYEAAKALNALYLCSAIFPAYLLLRKFTPRWVSVCGAAFLLLYPVQVVMPRSIISENLFYPLFMWALRFAFGDVLPGRSKNRWNEAILFGLLLGGLMLTRYIALALVPAFLLIWWLKPDQGERGWLLLSWKKIGHLLAVLLPLTGLVGVWLLLGAREGVPLKDLLGFFLTEDSNPAQLGLDRLLMWALFYLSFTLLIAAPYLTLLLEALPRVHWRRWREAVPRWWTSMAILVAFFLLAVVRHSWRAAYNYPDPSRLHERYVLYFGPLFILTVVIMLWQQDKLKTRRILASVGLAMALSGLAYALLFYGIAFVDYGLDISRSSPFGYIILSLDEMFLLLTGALNAIAGLAMWKGRKGVLGVYAACLAAFFIFGEVKVFQSILLPRQISNAQMAGVLRHIEDSQILQEDFREGPVVVTANATITDNQLRKWEYTLFFNGYQNIKFRRAGENELDQDTLMRVSFDGYSLRLREVEEKLYQSLPGDRFKFLGDFYTLTEGKS